MNARTSSGATASPPNVGGGIERVLILASTPYAGHQLYDQRLARAIIATGRQVIYVEPAVPALVRKEIHGEVARGFLHKQPDGVLVVSPRMIPFGRRTPLAALTATLVGLQIYLCLARLGRLSTGVLTTSAHPALARLFRRLPRVMIVKDDYVASSALTGLNPRPVLRRRRAMLRQHDVVTVVSPTLAETLLREGARTIVVPAGCEPIEMREPEPTCLRGVSDPRAVFTGMLSDRIDFGLLEDVTNAGFTLVFAGRRQFRFSEQARLDGLIKTGKAVELGELDPATLGQVMAHCDIGLVPYTMTDFNMASFPLKTFEYLAAGIPVVATPLPSILWLAEPNIFVTTPGGDSREAIEGARSAAGRPEVSQACRETASHNSWSDRADTYLRLLGRQVAA